MWFFGKDKNKGKDKPAADAAKPASIPGNVAASATMTKAEKAAHLMAQMRGLRAEIGEEELAKIVAKLKLDELKKQVRSDIDNDPKKRDRLLDEIRFHVQDPDNNTRH